MMASRTVQTVESTCEQAEGPGSVDDGPVYVTYEDFGRRFFDYAVSAERIAGAFRRLAGQDFDFGPVGAGPAGLARVSANVGLGEPILQRTHGGIISFVLSIPLTLHLLVDLTVDKSRFDVAGYINLRLAARAATPLRVVIEVDEPTTDDVVINVAPRTLRGSLLRIIADVDQEIKRFIVKYISREINSPAVEAAREIDVAARLDAAWRLEPQA
jgi:hypothetical protein